MKLDLVIGTLVAAGLLAADKTPEVVKAAILAADKKARDAEIEEKDQPNGKAAKDKAAKDKAAKDRKSAHDKARDAMSDEDKKAFDAMSDEDKDKAMDSDDDPERTNDEDVSVGDPSSPGGSRAGGKTAIDSAEVDRRIAAAVASRDELHTAHREVEPILGKVGFDSAGKAYRAALDHLKVDTKGVPDSALPAMLRLVKDRSPAPAPTVAMDTAGVSALEKAIPGYGRLR